VCLLLSCVLFCEKRLKLVTVKRSERTSQSFTSVCYEVWVSEVNVHDFFDSMPTSTVDIDRRPIFWYEGTSTVDIDRFVFGMNPYRRSVSTDFWVKSTVDQISTVFSSRCILIDRRYRPYSQIGESLSTVDIDRDRSTSRLKSNRPIDDTCANLIEQTTRSIELVVLKRRIIVVIRKDYRYLLLHRLEPNFVVKRDLQNFGSTCGISADPCGNHFGDMIRKIPNPTKCKVKKIFKFRRRKSARNAKARP